MAYRVLVEIAHLIPELTPERIWKEFSPGQTMLLWREVNRLKKERMAQDAIATRAAFGADARQFQDMVDSLLSEDGDSEGEGLTEDAKKVLSAVTPAQTTPFDETQWSDANDNGKGN